MAMDEKGLGNRLQVARQAAGLTQQALCQKANLSYSTLAKIERGAIKSPSIFTIQSIADALGTSLDDLIGKGSNSASPVVKERQRSKSGIRFVYFDINGCLVRFFHKAFTQLAEVSSQPADMVETAFWHYNDQVCRGELSMAELNTELAKRLQIPSLDWQKYYMDAVEQMPSMQELVKWVGENYGVGLLTNIMPGFVSEMRQRGIIPDIAYDAIIDSSEIHVIKPEIKIYEIANERADCAPSELLLVDDSRTNLMAAEKLGWHVLWFDDYHPEESAARIRESLEPMTESNPTPSSVDQASEVQASPAQAPSDQASPYPSEQTADVPS
jgi:putative hydrolase of the HAD superfamily